MNRILLIEDEEHLARGLQFNLEAEGHSVETEDTGSGGAERGRAEASPKSEPCPAAVSAWRACTSA